MACSGGCRGVRWLRVLQWWGFEVGCRVEKAVRVGFWGGAWVEKAVRVVV